MAQVMKGSGKTTGPLAKVNLFT